MANDSIDVQARVRELRQSLGRRHHLGEVSHSILGRTFHIVTAGDVDDLVDDLIAAGPDDPAYIDERIPYWAELWPSAVALAEHVLARPDTVAGKRAVELGCGLALTGLCAMAAGAQVLFTDYEPDALAFVELNALANLGRSPDTALMDWRGPDLGRRFDLVLAADVAYERRFFEPLADTFEALLAPGGLVLLSEPNRAIAEPFFDMLDSRGFERTRQDALVRMGDGDKQVAIHELRRRLESGP